MLRRAVVNGIAGATLDEVEDFLQGVSDSGERIRLVISNGKGGRLDVKTYVGVMEIVVSGKVVDRQFVRVPYRKSTFSCAKFEKIKIASVINAEKLENAGRFLDKESTDGKVQVQVC